MEHITSLLVLTLLEIILGIDNVLFISIAVQGVKNKNVVRYLGVSIALALRIVMLYYISFFMNFERVTLFEFPLKSLILELGGIFLVVKSSIEVYKEVLCVEKNISFVSAKSSFYVMLQIILIDLVFSLDSVLAAIALTSNLLVISVAFTIAMMVMLMLSKYSVDLLNSFPNLKILALLFIVLVGISLMADGLGLHIPQGYLYCAFIFSLIVEIFNIILNKNQISKF